MMQDRKQETSYQRDLRLLCHACQGVELGGTPDPNMAELATWNMKDTGALGDAAHFLIYSERAREARMDGNIVEALRWEAAREPYYKKLPEGYKW